MSPPDVTVEASHNELVLRFSLPRCGPPIPEGAHACGGSRLGVEALTDVEPERRGATAGGVAQPLQRRARRGPPAGRPGDGNRPTIHGGLVAVSHRLARRDARGEAAHPVRHQEVARPGRRPQGPRRRPVRVRLRPQRLRLRQRRRLPAGRAVLVRTTQGVRLPWVVRAQRAGERHRLDQDGPPIWVGRLDLRLTRPTGPVRRGEAAPSRHRGSPPGFQPPPWRPTSPGRRRSAGTAGSPGPATRGPRTRRTPPGRVAAPSRAGPARRFRWSPPARAPTPPTRWPA